MSASRRRFLKSAVAVGGVALGARGSAWPSLPAVRAAAPAQSPGRADPTRAEVEGVVPRPPQLGPLGP